VSVVPVRTVSHFLDELHMRPDPKVRKDRKCARPGCNNPLQQITERHRRYGGAALELEPFCSSTCAREWHGTQIGGTKGGGVKQW